MIMALSLFSMMYVTIDPSYMLRHTQAMLVRQWSLYMYMSLAILHELCYVSALLCMCFD